MNKEIPALYADRMQFLVATMTKDYDKARDIANAILRAEPGNTILENYLTVLEKEKNQRSRIRDDVNVYQSDSELSADSNSDNTDSNSDNSSDSESSASRNIAENKVERKSIDPKKFCQIFEGEDLVFDNCGEKSLNDFIKTDKTELRHNELKGKIIRVLPIRLSAKISDAK